MKSKYSMLFYICFLCLTISSRVLLIQSCLSLSADNTDMLLSLTHVFLAIKVKSIHNTSQILEKRKHCLDTLKGLKKKNRHGDPNLSDPKT